MVRLSALAIAYFVPLRLRPKQKFLELRLIDTASGAEAGPDVGLVLAKYRGAITKLSNAVTRERTAQAEMMERRSGSPLHDLA